MAEKSYIGQISIPNFTKMMIGSYVFPRDPTNITTTAANRNAMYAVLGSDVAELQQLGSGAMDIGLSVTLKTEAEIDDFSAAIRKPEEDKRFYVNSTKFYKVVGGSITHPEDGMTPVGRKMSATLVASEPFKYAHASAEQTDAITGVASDYYFESGGVHFQSIFLDNVGSAYCEPTFTFTSSSTITSYVSIGNIEGSVTYTGNLVSGDILIINPNLTATKNGTDVTGDLSISLTVGYPRLIPKETTEILIGSGTAITGSLKTEWRERWW